MKLFRCLLLIIGFSLFVSCQETERERFTRMVNEWMGKEILFPEHSVFTVQGKDTVNFAFRDADYKVVSYIDSTGCISCKLQLKRWKEFIAEVDSLTNISVPFLFYFYPHDTKELRLLTRQNGFVYPVCFDEKDSFNCLNRFPSEMMFQTLLLNKENKTVAIGNPVINPKMKELYLNLITGNEESKYSSMQTQVSVNQTIADLGKFPMKEKKEHCFALTNTGNNILVIQDVVTFCGCTKVEYSKEPVRPNGTLTMKVIYEADEPGYFNKSVMVHCNIEKSPLLLTIKGFAE